MAMRFSGYHVAALTALAITTGAYGQENINIGVPAIMTGNMAPYGVKFTNGVKVAAAEVNRQGGINVGGKTYKINPVFCDTKADATQAVSCGRRLSSKDGARVLIIATSIETYPILGFNTTANPPFLVITSTASGKLNTLNNPLVARYWFDISSFMPNLTKKLAGVYKESDGKIPRIGILEGKDEFGAAWSKYFAEGWKDAGGEIAGVVQWDHGMTDFYPLISTLLRSKPDVIASTGVCSDNGPIIKQSRELGFQGKFLIDQNCNPKELVTFVGIEKFSGSIFLGNRWDLDTDAVRRFKETYQNELKDLPTAISADGYGQLMWAVKAIQKAGTSEDANKIRAALNDVLEGDWNLLGIKDLQPNGNTTAVVFPRKVEALEKILNYAE